VRQVGYCQELYRRATKHTTYPLQEPITDRIKPASEHWVTNQ